MQKHTVLPVRSRPAEAATPGSQHDPQRPPAQGWRCSQDTKEEDLARVRPELTAPKRLLRGRATEHEPTRGVRYIGPLPEATLRTNVRGSRQPGEETLLRTDRDDRQCKLERCPAKEVFRAG